MKTLIEMARKTVAVVIALTLLGTPGFSYAELPAATEQQKTIRESASSAGAINQTLIQQDIESYRPPATEELITEPSDPVVRTSETVDQKNNKKKIYGYNAADKLVTYAEYRLSDGLPVKSDIRTYYDNGLIKTKTETVYTAAGTAVSSIMQYVYNEDVANEIIWSYQYRAADLTLWKETTAYVWVGTPPSRKAETILTYDTAGTSIIQVDEYAYDTATKLANWRKTTTYRATDGTKSKETVYLYLGTTAKAQSVLTYNTAGTIVTQKDEYTYDTATKLANWRKTTTYRADGTKSKETEYDYVGKVARAKEARAYNTAGTIMTQRTQYLEYYSNNKAKKTLVTTYNAAGTIVRSINDYLYYDTGYTNTKKTTTNTSAGVLSSIVLYTYNPLVKDQLIRRDDLRKTDNTVAKVTDYIYVDGTRKDSRIRTYAADGVTVTKDERWEYYAPTIIKSKTVIDAATGTTTIEMNNAAGLLETKTVITAAAKQVSSYGAGGLLLTVREYALPGEALLKETAYQYDAIGSIIKKIDSGYYAAGALKTQTTYDYETMAAVKVNYNEAGTILESTSTPIVEASWNALQTQIKTFGYDMSTAENPLNAWGMALHGYLMEYVNVLSDGVYRVQFMAIGNYLANEWPVLQVSVDGIGREVVAVTDGSDNQTLTYTVDIELTMGVHAISLDYINGTIKDPTGAYRFVMVGDMQVVNTTANKPSPVICLADEWEGVAAELERQTLAAAEARIEVGRQGVVTVKVVDADTGLVIENASVTIEETEQAFRFGGNYCLIGKFTGEPDAEKKMIEYNIAYLEKFAAVSNQATLGFFWKDLKPHVIRDANEAVADIYLSAETLKGMDVTLGMLAQKGITDVIGAALVWANEEAMPSGWFNSPTKAVYLEQLALAAGDAGLKDQLTALLAKVTTGLTAITDTDVNGGAAAKAVLLAQLTADGVSSGDQLYGIIRGISTVALTAEEKRTAVKAIVQKIIRMYSVPRVVYTINIAEPFGPADGDGYWWNHLIPQTVSIKTWEVLNEPFYLGILGATTPEGVYAWTKDIFDWAAEARDAVNPQAKLMLNDYVFLLNGNMPAFQELSQMVSTVKFDILGIQAHHLVDNVPVREGYPGAFDVPFQLDKLKTALDMYATLGKEIYISEFEMPSNEHPIVGSTWRGDIWDEATRSQYVQDFYTLIFSHPAIQGLTYWDLADTAGLDQWCPYSGLISEGYTFKDTTSTTRPYAMDLVVKQSYTDLYGLIRNQWMTKIVDARTGSDGIYAFRGFYGKYKITVMVDGVPTVFYRDIVDGTTNAFTFVV